MWLLLANGCGGAEPGSPRLITSLKHPANFQQRLFPFPILSLRLFSAWCQWKPSLCCKEIPQGAGQKCCCVLLSFFLFPLLNPFPPLFFPSKLAFCFLLCHWHQPGARAPLLLFPPASFLPQASGTPEKHPQPPPRPYPVNLFFFKYTWK